MLSFRVAALRRFPSRAAMLRDIGAQRLLPGHTLRSAAAVYDAICPHGEYVAWRISRPRVRESALPAKKRGPKRAWEPADWTKGFGMVERGVAQPRLSAGGEALLGRFARRMRSAGHRRGQVERHKDRLRYLAREHRGFRLLQQTPGKPSPERVRAAIKGLDFPRSIWSYLLCSFNWFVKFVGGSPLAPLAGADKRCPAAAGAGAARKRMAAPGTGGAGKRQRRA